MLYLSGHLLFVIDVLLRRQLFDVRHKLARRYFTDFNLVTALLIGQLFDRDFYRRISTKKRTRDRGCTDQFNATHFLLWLYLAY